ncbi:MAG TPA: hypothetical protein VFD02_04530 [Syntrophomonadaceae bacterium]|nr:hypothetical protein [Syntrophomonadaceae bacterium]
MMNNEEKILALLENMDGRFDKMDERLGNMDGRFDKIDERLGNMDGRMEGFEAGQGVLVNQVMQLTEDVQAVRQSQVGMENEFTEKIRALFDAREVSLDYFASIKSELVRIAESQETIRRTFYRLESKQDEQEREIRLLRLEGQ